jgi:hypothetical protein
LNVGFRQIYSVENAYPCIWPSNVVAASFSLVITRARVYITQIFALQQGDFACKEFMHANWPQIGGQSIRNHVEISLTFQQNFFV